MAKAKKDKVVTGKGKGENKDVAWTVSTAYFDAEAHKKAQKKIDAENKKYAAENKRRWDISEKLAKKREKQLDKIISLLERLPFD